MPIMMPTAFTTPAALRRRPRGALWPSPATAAAVWLSRVGGAALRRLAWSGGEAPHGLDGGVAASTDPDPRGCRRRALRPDPSLTAAVGGVPRAMDLAFSPQSFASGWLDRRP